MISIPGSGAAVSATKGTRSGGFVDGGFVDRPEQALSETPAH
jgi:hypothetical protein